MQPKHEFHAQMQQIDALLQEAEQGVDPAAQAQLRQVTASLLDLHRAGLERILKFVNQSGECAETILGSCLRDEIVSGLLVLHGMHPIDVTQRVKNALEKCRPYLASHGGHVELIDISTEGQVRLRLEGSCHGCPSSRVTLQSTIEQEIYSAAPEVSSISVEGLDEAPPASSSGFVPMENIAIHGSVLHAAP